MAIDQSQCPGLITSQKFGRNASPYLKNGIILFQKYRIENMIGGGGFGQVYRMVDEVGLERTGTRLAMKIELEQHEPARMVLEHRVLMALQGTPHIPYGHSKAFIKLGWWDEIDNERFNEIPKHFIEIPNDFDLVVTSTSFTLITRVGCGSYESFNYIVMELLGSNLSELRRQQRRRRFTVATVIRVGKQCCAALKSVHDIGYIHRFRFFLLFLTQILLRRATVVAWS
ncbi:unnamed protein product [Anisakis simplex]|uniref:Protein kinase domain-containing protein n=1 Tax=Anisakis simplex TaxID=6269 RepID=A0A0M3J348_ANISI|nr:unnamed protein product [Anisakis simplex]